MSVYFLFVFYPLPPDVSPIISLPMELCPGIAPISTVWLHRRYVHFGNRAVCPEHLQNPEGCTPQGGRLGPVKRALGLPSGVTLTTPSGTQITPYGIGYVSIYKSSNTVLSVLMLITSLTVSHCLYSCVAGEAALQGYEEELVLALGLQTPLRE